jgi:hypothetical protein
MRCFVIATAAILACLVPTSGAFRPLSLPFFRRGLAKVMETKNPHLLKNSHLLVNQPHPDQGREVTSLRTTVAAEEGDWTQKRIHNTNWFRCSVIILAIGAAGKSPLTSALSAQAAATIHLLSFATWLGTLVYTTFVLGITMFKNLPRQTFGKLQAKLFPKYFLLSTVTIMLQVSEMPIRYAKDFSNVFILVLGSCSKYGVDFSPVVPNVCIVSVHLLMVSSICIYIVVHFETTDIANHSTCCQ